MAKKQNSSMCGGLQLTTSCKPHPIRAAGATHEVQVGNFGYATYMVSQIVVAISGPDNGASIILKDGTTISPTLSWSAGTFGPSTHGDWSKEVKRQPAGTTKAHTITTAASFTSEADADPLNDEPVPTHVCRCRIDVMVP
ncbi:hypothetical protein ACQHIV_38110 [Kribbella sp. GL6]|uniref:hypothetical protein n=1 Tax=Kribbella sp. GL6 TaxID=3419765 RepID=UPI003D01CAF1